MTKVIFLGHSANIQRHLEICELTGITPVGFVDKHYFGNTPELDGLPVIGSELDISSVRKQYPDCVYFVGLSGTLCNPARRHSLGDLVEQYKLPTINLIHPSCVVGKHTNLGHGIFIDALCRIQNYSTIGNFAFIKEQCCVTHHVTIGKGTVICQQSYVGSNVTIGDHCYIGIKNAVLAPEDPIVIGNECISHPGVTIMRSLPSGTTAKIATSHGTGIHPPTVYM